MVDVAELASHYLGHRFGVWEQGELSAAEINSEGEALLVAIDDALARIAPRGENVKSVTLCFNPEVLGGCGGTDQSHELTRLLSQDRRFSRTFEGIGN